MRVTVDGVTFDVPDDATVNEIDAITKPKDALATAQKAESAKMGGLERTLASLGGGMLHGARKAANFSFGMPSAPAAIQEPAVKEEAQALGNLTEGNTLTGKFPAFVGEAIPQVAASMAAPAPAGAGLLLRLALASGEAGLQGAAFAEPGEREANAKIGAAVGPLFPLASKAISAIGTGLKPSGAGKYLADLGYGDKLSIGQQAPDSFIAKMEHAASRAPLLGQFVQRRQAEGKSIMQDELGKWMEPHPSAPAAALPQAGGTRPWFNEAATRLGTAYDDFAKIPKGAASLGDTVIPIKPQTILNDAQDAIRSVPGITPDEFNVAFSRINNLLTPSVATKGGATWAGMHEVRSNIREAIRNLGPDTQSQYVKKALQNMEAKTTEYLHSPLTDAEKGVLAGIDKAYSSSKLTQGSLVRQSGASNTAGMESGPLKAELESRLSDAAQARGLGGHQRDFVTAADEAFSPTRSDPSAMLSHSMNSNMSLLRFMKEALAAAPVALGTYSRTGQRILKGDSALNAMFDTISKGAPEGTEEALRAAAVAMLRKKKED
jgi:hypothetical protein